MRTTITTAIAAMVLTATASLAAPTPEEKCEAGKNQAAGKYAACLGKAEKDLISKGDEADYGAALLGCAGKMKDSWSKLEEKAADAGTVCPTTDDQSSIEDFMHACEQSVADALAGGTLGLDPVTCGSELDTCNEDLGTCEVGGAICDGDLLSCRTSLVTTRGALGTCTGDLGTCGTDLGTCNGNLGTCTGSLGTCATDLATCGSSLGSCTSSLTTANGSLTTCTGSLDTCNGNLATCGNNLSATNADLGTCGTNLTACQAATCGNNTAEFGETCDGADLHGKTCATEEAPSTPYGTLACNLNCDGFDASGCKARFTDNLDGTVTDNKTGLMWEKKTTAVGSAVNFADPHDVDNLYTWTAGTTAPTGTVFVDFLDKLNGQAGAGTGFAGYYDWRLPTLEELLGIVDPSAPGCGLGSPCIDAVFGATQSFAHWSSSTYQDNPSSAWYVGFGNGSTNTFTKTTNRYVRAVRAGS